MYVIDPHEDVHMVKSVCHRIVRFRSTPSTNQTYRAFSMHKPKYGRGSIHDSDANCRDIESIELLDSFVKLKNDCYVMYACSKTECLK